jgi:hypothetical protein
MTPRQTRPGSAPSHATGEIIARRNGVFNDSGVWKSRGWFVDVDRATGDHFTWYIDFICTGFDAGFLAANTVDPASTEPVLPLKPELTRTGAIAQPSAPIVVTAASQSVLENTELTVVLRANTGTARWAITGGADAASFEIAYTGGQWVLRWAGNGTKDFEAPDDAGLNNVYDVTVTATDFSGQSTAHAIAVTVTDVVESVTEFFDDFTGTAGSPLDTRLGYEYIAGKVNGLVIASNATLATTVNSNGTFYRLPDIGRVDNFQIRANFPSSSNVRPVLGQTSALTGQRISVDRNAADSRFRVIFWNASNVATVWVYPPNGGNPLIRLRVTGTTFDLSYDGVVQTPSSGPAQTLTPFSDGARFFVVNPAITDARASTMDNLYIGPV